LEVAIQAEACMKFDFRLFLINDNLLHNRNVHLPFRYQRNGHKQRTEFGSFCQLNTNCTPERLNKFVSLSVCWRSISLSDDKTNEAHPKMMTANVYRSAN